MKIYRKELVIVILAIAMLGIFTVTSNAATTYKALKGEATENLSDQNYTTWAYPVRSYLYENADGTLTRVEYLSRTKQILIENYDSSFNLKSTKKVANSLSLFGGFYSGSNYNFIVVGQNNTNEDNNLVVYRIEKYSKSWQKLGTADLKNCNTTVPFDAGACRMAESNGTLYIETCHEMYASKDGYNHQANVGIEVDIDTMNITYSRTGVASTSIGYVSHSFNQFIQAENGYSYTVNHGDAYPRSVILIKRGTGEYSIDSGTSVFPINGDVGENSTGVSVGGFELSNNNCIIAGNSVDQEADTLNIREARNVFLTITPKNNLKSSETTKVWLTKYPKNSDIKVTTPHLVKINGNKFAVMWEEKTNDNGGLVKIALVNESGKQIGNTISIGGRLSDCKPIVYKNNIVWYVTTANKTVTMFSVDVSSDSAFANSNGKNVISLSSKLNHFTYTLDGDDQILITGFDNKLKNVDFTKVNLPNWIIIKEISYNAFENATNLEQLTLPETLDSIRYSAFSGCKNLKGTVKIPKSVDIVYEYAFSGCNNVDQFVIESKNTSVHDFGITASKTVEVGKTIKPIVGLNYTKVESINKDVATVSNDGTIKVVGTGATNIYYYSASGHKIASIVIEGEPSYKLGDANGDGYVDASDAREVLKYCVGKTYLYATNKKAADVNKDGYVDAQDAREILKYCVGKTNF